MLCYQLIDTITEDNEYHSFIPFLSIVQFYKVIYDWLRASERYFSNSSAEYAKWQRKLHFLHIQYHFCTQSFLVSPSPIFWTQSKKITFLIHCTLQVLEEKLYGKQYQWYL